MCREEIPIHHLSALDALFLHLETAQTPMHVGSLILFEKPSRHRGSFYPVIRRHIASRLHLAPLFTRKLAFIPLDLANPVWVGGQQPDLDWHIRHLILPKPGSRAQLETAVARLHEGMLDRDRPLWQFTVIEGLASGEVAFTSRIHHAGLDGQGGVALAQAVLDIAPHAPPRTLPAADKAAVPAGALPPSAAKLLSAAFRNSVAQYGKILRALPGAGGGLAAGLLSSSQAKLAGAPSEQLRGSADLAALAGKLATLDARDTPLQAMKKLLPKGIKLGPRTPLNVAIGGRRAFATLRIPLAEAKLIARHFDVKLNEVVLATVAGALRRHHAAERALLAKAMIAAVPASLRAPGDTTANNQVTMMLVNLATHIADPAKRMAAIRESSSAAKQLTGRFKGGLSSLTSDLPTLGIPWLMGLLTPLYKSAVASNRIPVVANIVVSNVPGPPMPLYMAGAKMTGYFPVSIVTHGLALNITIHSYAGSLDYGLIAAKQEVPKLSVLVKSIEAAHRELLALATPASESAAPTPATRKPAARGHGKRVATTSAGKTRAPKTAAGSRL
jgi:WS/DGAT/MGAT family acyltransferase